MKRISALLITAMMLAGMCVLPAAAAKNEYIYSPGWFVEVSKELDGDEAHRYQNKKFTFELDVSKVELKGDGGWGAYAKDRGIKYDDKRGVLEITLRAGESITLEMPFGDEYSLTEVGGYDGTYYAYTTVNGVESMEHDFEVGLESPEYQKIEFVNVYEEDPEAPVNPGNPGGPGGSEDDDPDLPVDPGNPGGPGGDDPEDPDLPVDPGNPGGPGGDDPEDPDLPVDPNNPGGPGKPGDPDSPKPGGPGAPGDPNPGAPGMPNMPVDPDAPKPGRPTSPQTGYTLGILSLTAAAAASGAVAVIAGKKASKR